MLLSRGRGALRPLVRVCSPLQQLSRSAFGSKSSCVGSACGSRFLQQSRSFGSFSSSSASRTPSSGKRAAGSFFLDAQAACKGKRCSLSQFDGKNSKPESCGEDSYFLSPYIVGVADGVGGWNENGVDPGEISRSLMRNASEFVRSAKSEVTTQDVLAYGYKQALLDDNVRAGSTTACIVRLTSADDGRLVLQYTNLGDSGFAVLRDGHVVFRSKFQVRYQSLAMAQETCGLMNDGAHQYYGRAPYQLAKIPPEFKIYGAIENHPNDVRPLVLLLPLWL